jgi:hypothetical protein
VELDVNEEDRDDGDGNGSQRDEPTLTEALSGEERTSNAIDAELSQMESERMGVIAGRVRAKT